MRNYIIALTALAGATVLVVFLVGTTGMNFLHSGTSLTADVLQATTPDASSTAQATTVKTADVLKQFQDNIQVLDTQLIELRSQLEILNLRNIFKKTIKSGDTGPDVAKLQELFAKFPSLYSPDSTTAVAPVTGFYGASTKTMVMQFQAGVGLPENGIFDSATREKFYDSVNTLSQSDSGASVVPVDLSTVPDLSDQVSKSSSDILSTQATVGDLQNQISQLSSDLDAAKSEIADLQNQVVVLELKSSTPVPAPSSSSSSTAPKSTTSSSTTSTTKPSTTTSTTPTTTTKPATTTTPPTTQTSTTTTKH